MPLLVRNPTTPTPGAEPPNPARPCDVAVVEHVAAIVAPAATRAVRATGSAVVSVMPEVTTWIVSEGDR